MSDWDLHGIADELRAARDDWRAVHRRHVHDPAAGFPSWARVAHIMTDLTGALFPLRLGTDPATAANEHDYVLAALDRALGSLREQIRLELHCPGAAAAAVDGATAAARPAEDRAGAIVAGLARELPVVRRLLDSDVEAAFHGDPAARSVDEVLLCYPGVQAIIHHRLAHRLYRLGAPLVARIIAEIAHSATGIDIHPGATIGGSFFIDHGTGVVIGETAIIGERVRLYQAVTLGSRSFPAGDDGTLLKGLPRHPIVQDDVVIYAGATVLGRVTIGAGAVIGGNVWLTESVAPGAVIHQAFAKREDTSASDVPSGHID
jgi:serine O-acetyltransferase